MSENTVANTDAPEITEAPSSAGNGNHDPASAPPAAELRRADEKRDGDGQVPAPGKYINWKWRSLIVGLSILAVYLVWQITYVVTSDDATKFGSVAAKPLDGLTIFAVFFVAAAGIERLLEPIAGLFPDKADKNKEAQQKMSDGETDNAARAKNWVFGQTIGFWALASSLGIIASALLKLYLPYVVGIASGGRGIQILVTGLVIGAGTKPLHDLVGYMTAAKDKKEEADE